MADSNCSSICPISSAKNLSELYLEGLAIPLVGGLGLCGNVAAILVLRQPEMRSNFNQLLVALAALDIVYVATGIWDYSFVKVFNFHPTAYTYIFPYFWYPTKNILMSWTTFLTMGLATERYLAVCRPLLYRSLEVTYSSRVRVMTYFLPSMIFSILLNIPKFLEAQLVYITVMDVNNVAQETVIYNVTSLRVDPDYMYYYIHWTRLLCTGVIPFSFLSFLNILIYNKMRQNSLSSVRSKSQTSKKAGNLAAILIVIVLVFLVSNTPRLILNLTELAIHGNGQGFSPCGCDLTPIWYSITISVNHLFLTINSSINFLIYCSVGDKFKKIVCRFFTRIVKKKASSGYNNPDDSLGLGERKHKKSLDTDTTEVERKSEAEVSDNSEDDEDVIDNLMDKKTGMPMKLLSVKTIEEDLDNC